MKIYPYQEQMLAAIMSGNKLNIDMDKQCLGRALTMNIAMAKFYIKQGKQVVFATLDQQATVVMLTEHFSKGTLFELVGDWGVKIHER